MLLSGNTGRTGLWACCLLSLMFLVACGGSKEHKEEPKDEHKAEAPHGESDAKKEKGKEKKESKGEGGHGGEESKKDNEFNIVPPAIVAHLRIELNRETSEDKILPITPAVEDAPKVAAKEKAPKETLETPQSASPALTVQDMGYKTDKEYLALRRFELPVPKEEKKVDKRAGEKEEPDTIGTSEKILILGGKGSDIQGFRSKAKDSVNNVSNSHLEAPLAEPPPKKEIPHLDLKEDNIKNKRSLIFHQQGTGYFKAEEPEKKDEIAKTAPPKTTSPKHERVPETQLLFSQGKDNQLILRPKEGEIDLLLGNEQFNRKAYDAESKPVK